MKKAKWITWVSETSQVTRLIIAAVIGATVALLLNKIGRPSVHWMIVWLAFSLTYLLFSWTTIIACTPYQIRKTVKKQDSGRATLFVFVLIAACISLVAILLLYVTANKQSGAALLTHILLTMSSVGTAWTIVHTTFAFKYAHLYYAIGGLDFPDDAEPDYMDFIYFSYVIGTTFQVSDISITNKRLRIIAWLHGILSFAFNTIILALSINIISSQIGSK